MLTNQILKALSKSTDNFFDAEHLKRYADQIADVVQQKQGKNIDPVDNVDVPMDDDYFFNLESAAELEAKVFLREKIDKSLEELQQMPEWKDYQKGDWEKFSRARGYTEEEIDDFAKLQDLNDFYIRDNGELSAEIQFILNDLRNEYNKYRVEIDQEKILDKVNLPVLSFFSEKIKKENSRITKKGAERIARNYILKMLDEKDSTEVEQIQRMFKRAFSLKDEEATTEAVDAATRKLNLEEGTRSSKVSEPMFRSYADFHELDYEPAFVFPREIGVHIGTKGQAHTIIAAEFPDAPQKFFRGSEDIAPQEMEQFLVSSSEKLQSQGVPYKDFAVSKGYVNVRNPLVLNREPPSWKGSELLTYAGEFIDAIEAQSKNLPSDFNEQLDKLTTKAFELEQKQDSIDKLVSYKYNSLKNEVLEADLAYDIRKLLNRAGFDAIKYKNEVEATFPGEDSYSYILFSPYQFKSAYGKALDFEDPRTAYVVGGTVKGGMKILAPAIEGLFSPAEKAALNIQQKKGTGQAFINAVKKGEGVKEDELISTGFIDEFKDKKNVELEEVQNFLANNRLDLRKEVQNEYEQYSLARKDDLVEDVYTGLPQAKEDQDYFENVFYFPEDKPYSNVRVPTSHYGEGALGHTRVSILKEAETDKPVYVIDEVQSDLHQTGRTEGYVSAEDVQKVRQIEKDIEENNLDVSKQLEQAKNIYEYINQYKETTDIFEREDILDALTEQIDELGMLMQQFDETDWTNVYTFGNDFQDIYDDIDFFTSPTQLRAEAKNIITQKYPDVDPDELNNAISHLEDRYKIKQLNKILDPFIDDIYAGADELEEETALELYNSFSSISSKMIKESAKDPEAFQERFNMSIEDYLTLSAKVRSGVPADVPYKKKWHEYLLKQSLIDAVDRGYDKIGLTPGSIHTTRYGNMLNSKGFEKYYDEIYPKFLKSFGKKYGADLKKEWVINKNYKMFEVWTMDITPEMRKDIQKGLPKFAEGGYVIKRGDTLSQIAARNNTTIEELARLNNIEDINFIRAGDKLKLSEPKKQEAPEPQVNKVVVPKESKGIIPTNLKQFVKDLFGSDDLVTEEDITPEEKEALVSAVKKAKQQNKNILEYNDYQTQQSGENQYKDVSPAIDNKSFFSRVADPAYSMKTTIGQAQIKEDEAGNTIILDRYNFNDAKPEFDLVDFLKSVKSAGGSVYGQARNLARWFGSSSEEGAPVAINLGKIDEAFARNS